MGGQVLPMSLGYGLLEAGHPARVIQGRVHTDREAAAAAVASPFVNQPAPSVSYLGKDNPMAVNDGHSDTLNAFVSFTRTNSTFSVGGESFEMQDMRDDSDQPAIMNIGPPDAAENPMSRGKPTFSSFYF